MLASGSVARALRCAPQLRRSCSKNWPQNSEPQYLSEKIQSKPPFQPWALSEGETEPTVALIATRRIQ